VISGRRLALALVLVFVLGAVQLQSATADDTYGGDPSVRYVEFNGEQKWPGQTYIVQYGITLHVVAALKEPHKQSMTADLIFIDENGDSRVFRMTRFNTEGINEWHEYYVDTSTFNPGPYSVRINVWNAAAEETSTHKAVTSKTITWGDLYLSLQVSGNQAQPAKIPGFPWEGVILGIIIAISVIISRKDKALLRMLEN